MLCLRSGYVLAQQPLSEGEEKMFRFETPVVVKMSRYLIKKWQFFVATNTRFIYTNSPWCQTKWTQSLSRGHLFGVPSSSWHDTHAHLNLSVVCRHINWEDSTLTTGLDRTREVNWLPSSLQSKTMTGILCKTVTIDIARQRS